MPSTTNTIKEFLQHSNWIENERSEQALKDAYKAWTFARSYRRNDINLDYILKIHYLLAKNINPRIAGKLRHCDVCIGGKTKYFISESLLREELVYFLKLYKRLKIGDEKEAHVIFEHIHPFEDGNGRVGRILYNVHRINNGKDIHIIHEGREQSSYYLWFNNLHK